MATQGHSWSTLVDGGLDREFLLSLFASSGLNLSEWGPIESWRKVTWDGDFEDGDFEKAEPRGAHRVQLWLGFPGLAFCLHAWWRPFNLS
jgi:hypothetical protein